jgi:hypothetical protein
MSSRITSLRTPPPMLSKSGMPSSPRSSSYQATTTGSKTEPRRWPSQTTIEPRSFQPARTAQFSTGVDRSSPSTGRFDSCAAFRGTGEGAQQEGVESSGRDRNETARGRTLWGSSKENDHARLLFARSHPEDEDRL